jgi:hypothetical protein
MGAQIHNMSEVSILKFQPNSEILHFLFFSLFSIFQITTVWKNAIPLQIKRLYHLNNIIITN